MMDKKKAEEEISALITGLMILGMVVPVVMVSLVGKLSSVSSYLVSVGVLEQGGRVLWYVSDDSGLDLGRLLILSGVFILICACGNIIFQKLAR